MEKQELFKNFKQYVQHNILSNFTDFECEKFAIYFDALKEWNNKFNLISFKTDFDLIYRHFCDSLYSAKAILGINPNLSACRIADLGTGSGMPGIPVKIALPDIKLTLVESITKKCTFLEEANKRLGFNIEVLNTRAEEIGQNPAHRQKYDFVLSRAVSKFSPNLEISIPLLKIGGHFLVHKTKNSVESKEEGLASVENALKHLGAKLEKIIEYKLPEQELDYCLLIFKKYKDTPAQFPRKTGIPEKKPL
ncbi:MAG: 16S rRNA (guanine(527)-N(7))-methyltransferase RsmG [Endomicrobia bacterium]|nr:16S rRNA (guanine(527)-N(7))-methyltransferase RsmG [Endomicrobiia bacterium]MCL2506208.1 16S rRNA (guanine(527)-N(7))-methyltransferase RsmG [Endomicrobiia bacterium]